ncbi:MAG: hypothetical protein M3361_11895 [Candidatus Tectomicrobia bacterium]|nr:hypothetical protein [Candidatus Tectomicrobia bacterium]
MPAHAHRQRPLGDQPVELLDVVVLPVAVELHAVLLPSFSMVNLRFPHVIP